MSNSHLPQRIVCLQPSATAILATLGELGRVVACTKYCVEVCPEVAQSGAAIVADSWTAKAEEIVGAKRDLVIAAVPYQEKAVWEILKAGARFLGLAPRTLADIYGDIAIIAGAVGAAGRGALVIAAGRTGVLHSRRMAQHSRAYLAAGPAGPGGGHSSRAFSTSSGGKGRVRE